MRDQPVVGIDPQWIVLGGVKFDHRTTPHPQEMVDGHGGGAELNRDIDFNFV